MLKQISDPLLVLAPIFQERPDYFPGIPSINEVELVTHPLVTLRACKSNRFCTCIKMLLEMGAI
jgi:hypothetical protein